MKVAALFIALLMALGSGARAITPVSKILIAGEVADREENNGVLFAVVVWVDDGGHGTLVWLPCDGNAPVNDCDKLQLFDEVLIHAHFGSFALEPCAEPLPLGYNTLVYDSITVLP